MTGQYTFVAAERQNELTRRIQQKLAAAKKKQHEQPAKTNGTPPDPAPETPRALTDLKAETSTIQ